MRARDDSADRWGSCAGRARPSLSTATAKVNQEEIVDARKEPRHSSRTFMR
jgi:hypothetical protein